MLFRAVLVLVALATPAAALADVCNCERPLSVLAKVGDVEILPSELDAKTRKAIADVESIVIEQRRLQHERLAAIAMLEAEATKRGVGIGKLVYDEVWGKGGDVTDDELRAALEAERKQQQKVPSESRPLPRDHLTPEMKVALVVMRFSRAQQHYNALIAKLKTRHKVEVLVATATAPRTSSEYGRVFARVNGRAITSEQVERSMDLLRYHAAKELYSIRAPATDALIEKQLVAQEAKRRGISEQELIELEVEKRMTPISEAEVRKQYFASTGQSLQGTRQKLEAEQRDRLRAALYRQLRAKTQVWRYVSPPDHRPLAIAVDDQPARGPANAQVTIVLFGSVVTPDLSYLIDDVEALRAKYPADLRLVVRDLPFLAQVHSTIGARAAEAARAQGKYWEMVVELKKHAYALDGAPIARAREILDKAATAIGLDKRKFAAAMTSATIAAAVYRDVFDADALGIALDTEQPATMVFVNGVHLESRPTRSQLQKAIEKALDPQLQLVTTVWTLSMKGCSRERARELVDDIVRTDALAEPLIKKKSYEAALRIYEAAAARLEKASDCADERYMFRAAATRAARVPSYKEKLWAVRGITYSAKQQLEGFLKKP